jgi:hypothetical protein
LNIALATDPDRRLPPHQITVQRIIGPCTYVLGSGDLHAFSREQGVPGLYALDGRNGNLFFEPRESEANPADAGRLAALERALFERQIKLACLREDSWTLEDGYAHLGGVVEALTDGLAPTVEIFDLTRVRAAVPVSRVQGAARFVIHSELPLIALSQPLHTSECDPRQWDMGIASSRRAG